MRRWANERQRRREFEELTYPHLDALYRFAFQRVRDVYQAEDLVQEVCLKAYRSFDRFERGTDYKAWLFRILINLISDFQRKASRKPVEIDLETEDFLAKHSTESESSHLVDPERQLLAVSLAREVQAAIDALPQEWQVVVLLSFLEEFSYKEIADILNCPIGTVMSRLYRARQVLRRRLVQYLQSEGDTDLENSSGQGASVMSIDLIRARRESQLKKKEG